MTVSLTLVITMAVLFAAGVYAMTERSLSRILIGFLLMGNAVNLLLIVVSGAPGDAPIVTDGRDSTGMADSLPQGLVLTAIVITFGVSALLLALIYRNWRVARQERTAEEAAVPGSESHSDVEAEQISLETHEDEQALHEAIDASDEQDDREVTS